MLTLGKKIQKARKEANISQVELAKKLNVRQGSISNWERDERKPELQKLQAIARIVNKPMDYFFDDELELDEEGKLTENQIYDFIKDITASTKFLEENKEKWKELMGKIQDSDIKNNPYIKRIPGVVFLRKLGSIKAGHPSFLSDENNEVIYIPIPSNYINGELSNCKTQKQIDEHFFIVEVVGDSMYDTLKEGEELVIKVIHNNEIINGNIYAVMLDKSYPVCKRVYKQDTQLILSSDNQKYEPIIVTKEEYKKGKDVKILGEVISYFGTKHLFKKKQ